MINIEIVRKYLHAGLSVIPILHGSKEPAVFWKTFQSRLPSDKEIVKWFTDSDFSIAVVCGLVSGSLLILDIDNHFGDADRIYQEFKELVDNNDIFLWEKLVVQKTQSGGYHIIFRCNDPPGNLKLARRWKIEGESQTALIETRGEGGYALIAPSPNYELIQGRLSKIAMVSDEDRDLLLSVARSFDEVEKNFVKDENYISQVTEGRPGDDFNKKCSVEDVKKLLNDWTWIEMDGYFKLRRPGKDKGISATFNVVPEKLYVFSSNAYPFEPNRAYDKFSIYTLINHHGDFKAAAKDLARQGYGTLKKSVVNKAGSNSSNNGGDMGGWGGDKNSQNLNVIDIVEQFLDENFHLRFNVVKNYVEFQSKKNDSAGGRWEQITDREVNDIWKYLKRFNKSVTLQAIQSVINSHFCKDFHPIINYFDNLPAWDGENHIKNLLELVKVADGQEKLWRMYITKWLVGCVASALERDLNHVCVVLIGSQGIGKTTFIDSLVPPELQPYYYTGSLDPQQKDSKILVCENFLINLDELETSTRNEIGLLKSLMTTTLISYRYPYGRNVANYRHRASFIASINKSQFLNDVTGSRRFLPVEVLAIDKDALRGGAVNINQLWAQARYKLDTDYRYWFSDEEVKMINENNTQFEVISPEEELILKHFAPYKYSNESFADLLRKEKMGLIELLSGTEIFEVLQKNTSIRLTTTKLGMVLKKLGFHQFLIKEGEKVKRVYLIDKQKDYSF